jgi:hypothetical protein
LTELHPDVPTVFAVECLSIEADVGANAFNGDCVGGYVGEIECEHAVLEPQLVEDVEFGECAAARNRRVIPEGAEARVPVRRRPCEVGEAATDRGAIP